MKRVVGDATGNSPDNGEEGTRAPRRFVARRKSRTEGDGGGVRFVTGIDSSNDARRQEIYVGSTGCGRSESRGEQRYKTGVTRLWLKSHCESFSARVPLKLMDAASPE